MRPRFDVRHRIHAPEVPVRTLADLKAAYGF